MATVPHATRPWWMPERKAHSRRKRANSKFYKSAAWVNLATAHKRANPLCVQCLEKGISTPVWCTDHIVPINAGGDPLAWDNLQSLCYPCHCRKSGKEAHTGSL